MARHEADREDLFAELAALNPRVEVRVDGEGGTVCAGRRESTGGWSLYLTPDRVYHFDGEGRLRRAYLEGFLYRSEGATLSRLRRERSTDETALMRTDLDADELAEFVSAMRSRVAGFVAAIDAKRVEVVRASGDGGGLELLREGLERSLRVEPAVAGAIRG